ncbi:MAG: thermonuclease family protein [Verrucomicrobiota bacterium]
MFYTIRKAILCAIWGLLLLGGWRLYANREVFRPLVDLVRVSREMTFAQTPQPIIGQMTGQVIQVTAADTFRVRNAAGTVYHFRVDGVDVPQPGDAQTRDQARLWTHCRTNLSSLILSNQVRIDITSTNLNRGGWGVVYVNGTNLNLKLVEAGTAQINPNYLKSLPLKEQYAFLVTQKKARELHRGIWKSTRQTQRD